MEFKELSAGDKEAVAGECHKRDETFVCHRMVQGMHHMCCFTLAPYGLYLSVSIPCILISITKPVLLFYKLFKDIKLFTSQTTDFLIIQYIHIFNLLLQYNNGILFVFTHFE